MSFFLLTLLGLTGAFGGVVAIRQATWKHSHFHKWRRELSEKHEKDISESLSKKLAEAEKKRIENESKKKQRKPWEEKWEKEVKEVKGEYITESPSKYVYHHSTTNGYTFDVSRPHVGMRSENDSPNIRNLQAEVEEENRRRNYLLSHGSMLGYNPYFNDPSENYNHYLEELKQRQRQMEYLKIMKEGIKDSDIEPN